MIGEAPYPPLPQEYLQDHDINWPNWNWASWVCKIRVERLEKRLLHCGIPAYRPPLQKLLAEANACLMAALLTGK